MSSQKRMYARAQAEKMYNQIMHDPRYRAAREKELDDAKTEAFDMFLALSIDYMSRHLGFEKKRVMKFLEYVNEQILVYQTEYVPTDPSKSYWEELQEALFEELGIEWSHDDEESI